MPNLAELMQSESHSFQRDGGTQLQKLVNMSTMIHFPSTAVFVLLYTKWLVNASTNSLCHPRKINLSLGSEGQFCFPDGRQSAPRLYQRKIPHQVHTLLLLDLKIRIILRFHLKTKSLLITTYSVGNFVGMHKGFLCVFLLSS